MKEEIKTVLVIGSGPIIIGQSAEFDYAGTQVCRALREEGVRVILVNSNPATIQTDGDLADVVYIEPLTPSFLEKIIEKERPDTLLAVAGGQTALNLAITLHNTGVLKKFGVRLIGTDAASIEAAESREKFSALMKRINIPIVESIAVKTVSEAMAFVKKIGYPVILRPAYTLGGTGGGIATNEDEFLRILDKGFNLSATHEILIEKSIAGWGEFEYEVVRDAAGNSIIVCNMENLDPMGVHTGESIVIAPSQTLSDREHQMLRSAALRIVDALNIKGSCNVQFGLNQQTGEYVVIEVNPRLSRSSALASKATGYPIARIAAKIALGKKLHEIKNAITGTTAAFEPSLDYVVTKIPRWPFDKYRGADRRIGTQMKSTGDVMAIGRTMEESLMKAIHSLDIKLPKLQNPEEHLYPPTDLRLFAIFELLRQGKTVEELHQKTRINHWFLEKLRNLIQIEQKILSQPINPLLLREAKRCGFSDAQLAKLKGISESEIRKIRKNFGITPTYKIVDSCAGEFQALTPYYYSTYETENEAPPIKERRVIVIGSGPIRIGQGIEFDYCCCHAAIALKEMGVRSIMINNNPETVSTDFDSSDRLYFEPITVEHVLNVIEN